VAELDVDRFMGDWFVVAHLPTRAERKAYDAVESYRRREDGKIDIRFTFREGSFDGERRELSMLGWVHDERSGAEWRVRPFWPLRLDYLVLHVSEDYGATVIGHPSRDYAWIMTREPAPDAAQYAALVAVLAEQGYPVEQLRVIPQSPR
jgi:apolipoprotein D and lipocalin family protein